VVSQGPVPGIPYEVVECSIVSLEHRVVAVDSHYPGDRARLGKRGSFDKALFRAYNSEKFDNTSYHHGHAVGILSVRNIKCYGVALDLARKYGVRGDSQREEQYSPQGHPC